jgi:hypothetical protein
MLSCCSSGCCPATTTTTTEIVLQGLIERDDSECTGVLINGVKQPGTALLHVELRCQESRKIGVPLSGSIALNRRTDAFANCFSNVKPKTGDPVE